MTFCVAGRGNVLVATALVATFLRHGHGWSQDGQGEARLAQLAIGATCVWGLLKARLVDFRYASAVQA